jgi:hypothetical protein
MCGGGACVSLDVFKPRTTIDNYHTDKQEYRGHIYFKPTKQSQRFLYAFQNATIAEKLATIINESFHISNRLLKIYASVHMYDFLKSLHDGAHTFHEGLHNISILNDIVSMICGKFIIRKHIHGTHLHQIDIAKTAARITHFIAHGISTTAFMGRLNIIPIRKWDQRLVIVSSALTLLGYTIHTTSLIWNHFYSHQHEHHLRSDLLIQGSGILIESVFILSELNTMTSAVEFIALKIRSSVMIIQSLNILDRLSPEKHKIKFKKSMITALTSS